MPSDFSDPHGLRAAECVVIVNPSAGSAAHDVSELRERLSFLPDTIIRSTEQAGDARRIAQEAARAGISRIVVAGGDGTLHEVINGLAPTFGSSRLGILPTGTGNDAARTLGIPLELEGALEGLKTGASSTIDVLEIGHDGHTTFALNAATGGFGGAVNEAMTVDIRELWGPLAYVRAATEVIVEPETKDLTLVFPDREEANLSAISLVVANGRYAAGGLAVAPGARVDDGLLNVHAVVESSPVDLIRVGTALLAGQVPEVDSYRHWESQRISVRCTEEFRFSVDGELLAGKEWRFAVHPAALMVLGAALDHTPTRSPESP